MNYHDQVPVGNAFGGFCLDLVRAIGCKRDLPFLIVASGVGLQNQVYLLFRFLSRRNSHGISADLGGDLIIAVSCIGEYPFLIIRSVKRANLCNAAVIGIVRFIVVIHLHIQRLMPVLDEPGSLHGLFNSCCPGPNVRCSRIGCPDFDLPRLQCC